MSVMEDLEATCIHIITSETNFYSSRGKYIKHPTGHLSNYLVEINLKHIGIGLMALMQLLLYMHAGTETLITFEMYPSSDITIKDPLL